MSYLFREEVLNNEQLPSCFLQPFLVCLTLALHTPLNGKNFSGDAFLLDGTHVNHELVKDGWCWWYYKYAPGDTVLEGLERETREAKKGLWIDPATVPPWVYRKAGLWLILRNGICLLQS